MSYWTLLQTTAACNTWVKELFLLYIYFFKYSVYFLFGKITSKVPQLDSQIQNRPPTAIPGTGRPLTVKTGYFSSQGRIGAGFVRRGTLTVVIGAESPLARSCLPLRAASQIVPAAAPLTCSCSRVSLDGEEINRAKSMCLYILTTHPCWQRRKPWSTCHVGQIRLQSCLGMKNTQFWELRDVQYLVLRLEDDFVSGYRVEGPLM